MASTDGKGDDNGYRRATVTYLLALGLVAALAVTTHLLVDNIVQCQEMTARVVNISGRQRMLSQRIAELALEISVSQPAARTELETQLRAAMALMGESHRVLVQSSMTTTQAAIYENAPNMVNSRVERYLGLATDFLDATSGSDKSRQALDEILSQAHQPILAALDAAVKQYQRDSESAIRRLRVLLMGMMLAMLATLAAEASLIFRPLFRRLAATQQALVTAAQTDPLTGCLNRRHFLELGAREFARHRRNDLPLAIMLLDIDHFKNINDTYGHASGDAAITVFTNAILSGIRATDFLGRMGGEEFAVTLPDTTLEGAVVLAEKLRVLVAEAKVVYGISAFSQTASIGVSFVQPGDDSLLTALDRADKAMYQAKHAGRNRVATLEEVAAG